MDTIDTIQPAGTDTPRHDLKINFEAPTAEPAASLQGPTVPSWLAELVASELRPLSAMGGFDLAVTVSFGSFEHNGRGRLRIGLTGRGAISQPLFALIETPISGVANCWRITGAILDNVEKSPSSTR